MFAQKRKSSLHPKKESSLLKNTEENTKQNYVKIGNLEEHVNLERKYFIVTFFLINSNN